MSLSYPQLVAVARALGEARRAAMNLCVTRTASEIDAARVADHATKFTLRATLCTLYGEQATQSAKERLGREAHPAAPITRLYALARVG